MELKQISTCFILFLVLVFLSEDAYTKNEKANTNFIDYVGYSNCIKLENKNTRVILGPHCGGRILEYSWKNKNAIYLDPAHDGWMYHADKPEIDPSGGRFDIGPENILQPYFAGSIGFWPPFGGIDFPKNTLFIFLYHISNCPTESSIIMSGSHGHVLGS